MKILLRLKYILGLVMIMVIVASCSSDFDIDNLNAAGLEEVLADPDEYDDVINAQFNSAWWNDGSYWTHTLSTMGDGMSMSWGNWGCNELSSEPRVALNNSPTWTYAYVVEDTWTNYYSVIGAVNDVLRIYKSDETFITHDDSDNDITYQVKAKAKYLQGHSYGVLSKIYDKAKIVSENVDLLDVSSMEYADYTVMADSAVKFLEEAIAYANSGDDFTVGGWNGISITRDQFVQICRTTQARILVHNARNETENAATDWAAVLDYASEGVDFDFSPVGDGSTWWKPFIYYGNNPDWSRVDMRIINMLDDSQPSRYPVDGSDPGEATSDDARLESYMVYEEDIPFRAERGLYHYSHYDFNRFAAHESGALGTVPTSSAAETNLLMAEALIMSGGSKTEAASLINETRTTNGDLSGLTGAESDEVMLNALFYERWLELMSVNAGTVYYDRRRLPEDDGSYDPYSGLQSCTPRNFPIPGSELQLLTLEVYTFGGCTD